MIIDAGRLIVRATLWFLRQRGRLADLAASIEHFRKGALEVASLFPGILPPAERVASESAASRLAKEGVPADLAARVAHLDAMFNALDIVEVSDRARRGVEEVARLHFGLSAEIDFPWLRSRIGILPAENHWQTLAKGAMRDELADMLRSLTADALRIGDADTWRAGKMVLLERFRQILSELRAAQAPDYAMLSVAMRELRNLASV